MKGISVIAIIFVLAFRPLVPLVEYVANYDQIVTEYCINRMQPELMCNGKCYLFDELSKTSDENSSDGISQNTVKIQEIYLSNEVFQLPTFMEQESSKKSLIFYQKNQYQFYFIDSVFHPPLV
ncbi:MAG: hypothetical protein GX159_07300 [Flavobacteriaceae bacterium]|jgi:hypothetical protein|nr:hypothetical protein [Flavobacteriaceae bacterium]